MKTEIKYVLYNRDNKKYDKGDGALTDNIYEVPRSNNIDVIRSLLNQKKDPVNWSIQEIQVQTEITVLKTIKNNY